LNDLRNEPSAAVREWLLQQVLTNILNLALLVPLGTPHLVEQSRALAGEFLAAAQRWLADLPAGHEVDPIAKFICTAAAAVYALDPAQRERAGVELQQLDFPPVRPFDTARKTAFKRLAADPAAR
jgi:hypothetical protein